MGEVSIGEQKGFQVKISAAVGKNHLSDIAVDDIKFIDCVVGQLILSFTQVNKTSYCK